MNSPCIAMHPRIAFSGLEVDFDRNSTDLYSAITERQWDVALEAIAKSPDEARTWVVRYFEDEYDPEIMWRFLPIHSACARQPPFSVIAALLRAYQDGAKCIDDQGMYALHYACGNKVSDDVLEVLLKEFNGATELPDSQGMLPLHYMASWGPSSLEAMEMLLQATRNGLNAKDDGGNTPLDLALKGEYAGREQIVVLLQEWRGRSGTLAAKRNVKALKIETPREEKKDNDHDASPLHDASPRQTERAIICKSTTPDSKNLVQDHISRLEEQLQSKDAKLLELQNEVRIKDALLQSAAAESNGLRKILETVNGEYAEDKKQFKEMERHLSSLDASIKSVLMQHDELARTVDKKEGRISTLAEKRLLKLKEIMVLDEEMMSSESTKELTTILEKQTNDMVSVQALLATLLKSTSK